MRMWCAKWGTFHALLPLLRQGVNLTMGIVLRCPSSRDTWCVIRCLISPRSGCLNALKAILQHWHMSMVSCKKGPTRHAYAWQIGPFGRIPSMFTINLRTSLTGMLFILISISHRISLKQCQCSARMRWCHAPAFVTHKITWHQAYVD